MKLMNRSTRRALQIVLAVGFSVTALLAADDRLHGEFSRTWPAPGPITVSVQNAEGSSDVAVRVGEGNEVRVRGVISAGVKDDCNRKDAERKVQRFEANPAVAVRDGRIEIGAWGDSAMSHCTTMNYELQVPARTRMEIEVKYGQVSVYDVNGPLHIRLQAGTVRLKDPGQSVRAETRVGQINVDGQPRADWALEIGMGGVELRLPKNAPFTLDADVGAFESDFFTYRMALQGARLVTPVNGGGPHIRVRGKEGGLRILER